MLVSKLVSKAKFPDVFILIVEDHPLVADSLQACVHACDAALNVCIAETLGAALLILENQPSPVLITTDLTLPDAQGIESVRRLRKAAPTSPLLVFTALDNTSLRREAKELGVIDYFLKSVSSSTFRSKISSILGERVSPSSSSPTSDYPTPTTCAILHLTAKQKTVMQELVAGRSNREIATRMNISTDTVSSHLKEIFNRLSVRNRTEAVVRYLEISSPATLHNTRRDT